MPQSVMSSCIHGASKLSFYHMQKRKRFLLSLQNRITCISKHNCYTPLRIHGGLGKREPHGVLIRPYTIIKESGPSCIGVIARSLHFSSMSMRNTSANTASGPNDDFRTPLSSAAITPIRGSTPVPQIQVRQTSTSARSPKSAPVRILMLHGFTQSGDLFHHKTRALEKVLQKALPEGCELVYPTAPNRLKPSDLPGALETGDVKGEEEEGDYWAWARWNEGMDEYIGLEETWKALSEVLEEKVRLSIILYDLCIHPGSKNFYYNITS